MLDTPRQRRQVRRYGNDQLQEEIVDMIDPREDVIPSRGRHGWTKIELFKTEKWMLIYGYRNGSYSNIGLDVCVDMFPKSVYGHIGGVNGEMF